MAVSFCVEKGNVMAKAYRCDLCNNFADDCYAVGGIDIYPNELRKMGIEKDSKHEVKEICEDCHNKLKSVANEIFEVNHKATTEQ